MKHQNIFYRNQMTTTFLLMLLILEIVIFAPLVFGQPISFDRLIIDKPIKRSISPGEIHGYQISVEKDQFVHLKIESLHVQLIETVTLSDSQNVEYARFDSPEGFSIKLIAEESDLFRVQLKADSLDKKGSYTIVLEELQNATANDKTELTAKMLYDYAFVLERKGGADTLQMAKQKYSEALLLWQNIDNYDMTIATLHRLGETCYKMSDFHGMKIYYYRALRQSRQHKDVDKEVESLYNIGVAQKNINEAYEALDVLEQALEMSLQLKNYKLEAKILDMIGSIHSDFDDYEKGLEYVQKSLTIKKELGDEEQIAISLQTLGQIYAHLGENQKALDHYHQALQLFRKVGRRYSEGVVLGEIGHVYYQFADYQPALDYFQQCLDISKEIGNRLGEAWAVKIMGDIYRLKGNYDKALNNYSISIDICRTIGVRVGVGANLSNSALVYIAKDSTEKALKLLNESLVLNREINNREGTASVLLKIGDLYAKTGDLNKAIDYYQQALVIAKTLQDPRLSQRIYFPLGKQERRAGRTELARSYLENSIQIADSLRRSVLSQNMRASYFALIHSCFDELLLLFMQQHQQNPDAGYDRLAFKVSEGSRGQSMLEMLNESQVDLRADLDPALLERERRLRQELNAKAQQRQRIIKSETETEKLTSLEAKIRTLLTEHENLETRIRQQQPRLAAIEKAEALPVEKIQTEVLDDSTALIEYALIDERSFAWVVTSDNMVCFELLSGTKIDSTARLVYENLTARNITRQDESAVQRQARIQAADKQLSLAMSDLSDMILSPLAGHLNKARLAFVCDGMLQYIPLGVLPLPPIEKKSKKSYDPLVNHFEILSVPSASAVPLIRQEKIRAQRPEKLIAMFADPVFSADDPRLTSPVPAQQDGAELIVYAHLDKALQESGVGTRSDLSRLPFSRSEANDIIALTGSENCKCYLDFDANYSQANAPELSNFKIIHFATHGMMNNMNPELSGLVLSLYDQQGQPQNGFLRLHDIYQLELNADLVVLSACQTALGKDVKGEGLIGLTRGFMYAGAPRVVASLWKVDDEATAELMKRFYQFMLGEEQLPAAAALRKAQISIMNEKRWQSPYYWAGFVLQGDWK